MVGGTRNWAVLFDWGAATASEIGSGIAALGGGTVVLADSEFAGRARPLLERFAPVVSLADGIESVTASLKAAEVRGITTFSERMQPVTATMAEALGLPYHSLETVRALTDKSCQRERLRAAGVDPLRSHVVGEVADWDRAVAHVGVPAVLKPCRGEGSRNTYRVDDAREGHELARTLLGGGEPGPLLLEEYLIGRDERPFGDFVSVECVAVDGDITPLMVTGKLPQLGSFREAGQFWPAHLPGAEADEVRLLAVRALRALGVTMGLSHVEIKLTPSGPRLIEVNGRAGGTQNELARRAAGIDLVAVGARIALGEQPRLEPIVLDEVCFQFFPPAPVFPCRLDRYRGVSEALGVTGVSGVRPLVSPGTRLSGHSGTLSLQLVCGSAAAHEDMFGCLAEVRSVLGYDFTVDDVPVRISAEELWR